jgi:hypothetical protein
MAWGTDYVRWIKRDTKEAVVASFMIVSYHSLCRNVELTKIIWIAGFPFEILFIYHVSPQICITQVNTGFIIAVGLL